MHVADGNWSTLTRQTLDISNKSEVYKAEIISCCLTDNYAFNFSHYDLTFKRVWKIFDSLNMNMSLSLNRSHNLFGDGATTISKNLENTDSDTNLDISQNKINIRASKIDIFYISGLEIGVAIKEDLIKLRQMIIAYIKVYGDDVIVLLSECLKKINTLKKLCITWCTGHIVLDGTVQSWNMSSKHY